MVERFEAHSSSCLWASHDGHMWSRFHQIFKQRERKQTVQFAAVCCFDRGGAFLTYLSNQLIRSAKMCSKVSRPA